MGLQPDRSHVDAARIEDGVIDAALKVTIQARVTSTSLAATAAAFNVHKSRLNTYLHGTPHRADVVAIEMMARQVFSP